jgi:hypothetical protein
MLNSGCLLVIVEIGQQIESPGVVELVARGTERHDIPCSDLSI